MTMNGTLEDYSPAGILKVLAADGRTGAARFGGPAECTVYLHRGQLYFARNDRTDEALATALVRPGRLSADDWGNAIEASEDRPVVGELLVRNGAIAPDLLASVALSVIYDPLIELFRDGTGDFDFETDTVHWLGPFRAFPVDAIVGEVRKRVREVDEWAASIPSLDSWVEANRTLPGTAAQVTLLREDWELVTSLGDPRTIEHLAADLGRGVYSTARVVNRLQDAGLVRVLAPTAEAQVVQLHRAAPVADTNEGTSADQLERDPLLDQGLPHRTSGPSPATTEPSSDEVAADPLTVHIGDTIAGALADTDDVTDIEDPVDFGTVDADQGGGPALSVAPAPPDAEADEDDSLGTAPVENADDEPVLTVVDDDTDADTDGSTDEPAVRDQAWDDSRRIADGNALHHDGQQPTSLDEPRPKDPNAAWLADLYAQFIEDDASGGKRKKRNEPNALDVAFKADEQDGAAKVSTLKRLLGALKKL